MQKIKTIADPNHVVKYGATNKGNGLIGVIKSCLEFDSKKRASIPALLASEYLVGSGARSGGIKQAVGNPKDPDEWGMRVEG